MEEDLWEEESERIGGCAGVLVLQPSPPWGRGCPGVPGRVRGSPHVSEARDARRDRYLEFRLPNGIVLSAPEEFMKRVLNRVSRLPNVFTDDR